MRIQRYKDDWYKYFYEKSDDTRSQTADVPDELFARYQAAEELLKDLEREMDRYFK